ncbi:hypothetical protein V6N13_064849 [Hibiscus sabdariffa]|uniref:RNase H type-1 domain-containing protein n=1 Tax=Hibiscus sabdariffa TaxID=183260 RepID=A0ABR2EEW5_9ROSI
MTKGKTLLNFSTGLEPDLPILGEIRVIEHALSLFLASLLFNNYRLITESDSLTVVEWIKNPAADPPCFSVLITDISDCIRTKGFFIRHAPRTCSVEANGYRS